MTGAAQYAGGVLLAVDSSDTGGMYIGSGSVKKIIEINRFLLGSGQTLPDVFADFRDIVLPLCCEVGR